jgi:hypothetical protein
VDKALPIKAESNNEQQEPILETPYMDMLDPSLPHVRRDIDDASLKKSSTDTPLPHRLIP